MKKIENRLRFDEAIYSGTPMSLVSPFLLDTVYMQETESILH